MPTKSDAISIALFNKIILELNKTVIGFLKYQKENAYGISFKNIALKIGLLSWQFAIFIIYGHSIKSYIYSRGS